MASEKRVIVVSKKGGKNESDDVWEDEELDGSPTHQFTAPLEESKRRFTAPREKSKRRFPTPLEESRFTAPLEESKRRYTAPVDKSTDRFTTPLRGDRDRFTAPLEKPRRKYSRFSSPPKEQPENKGRNQNNLKRSHSGDYYKKNGPSQKDRRLSPPLNSYDNISQDSNRSHSTDYYRRNRPSSMDRQLSPSRDFYDNFNKDSNRHNSHDKDDYSNEKSIHIESSSSNLDSKRTTLDASILITTTELRNYAERIARKLKNIDINTEIRAMPDSMLQSQIIEEIANQGVLYIIIINSQNEAHSSLTLHIFQDTPQEHRNMPTDDAMTLVTRNFKRYVQGLKEKYAASRAASAASSSPSSQSIAPTHSETTLSSSSTSSSHPNAQKTDLIASNQKNCPFLPPPAEISYFLHLLADCRYVTLQELNKVLDYLNARKRELLEMSQSNTSKGSGDFSTGDDLQRINKNHTISSDVAKTDFPSKILSMIMPSKSSVERNANMNNPLQQSLHNMTGQTFQSGNMMSPNQQALQQISAKSKVSAMIDFNDPSVKKALDSLIQSGPSLIQNINAVTKNTNLQQLPANAAMNRNQDDYNQYNMSQSVNYTGGPQMSQMAAGRTGFNNVRPNMNSQMNMNAAGHLNQYDRHSNMAPNGLQMARGPLNSMQGSNAHMYPQRY